MRRLGICTFVCTLSLWLGVAAEPSEPGRARVDFNREVRPILSENCFACHGPDKGKRKGELRLDTKEGAFADGGLIKAGKPAESELIARIETADPEEVMPPRKSGKALTKGQVETLRRWVAEGAEWKGHWAYLTPEAGGVPGGSTPEGFVRNDIDRFVWAKQAERELKSSGEADRATLIRRLSFDLRGLPPRPEEVDAFGGDKGEDAYLKLVDRLLGSTQYGERMAVMWLDLVRYADTTGYHGDNHRDIALYRDYVIEAFNKNMAFDRFTTEQLAGDLLPGATDAQRVASGYHHLLMTTREGGAQAKEYLAKYAADRVRNASTVWMGATLGCAECHDHKFDPYTTKDFYRFAAFFADIQETAVGAQEQVKLPTAAQSKKAGGLDGEIGRLQAILETTSPALAKAQEDWEKAPGSASPEWVVLTPEGAKSEGGATLTVRGDGSVSATGKSAERDRYTITLKNGMKRLTALRLEVMPDGSLPGRGPGRAGNGNFVLNEFEVEADGKRLGWTNVTATYSQAGYAVSGAGDGDAGTGWAVQGETGRPNAAVFEAKVTAGPGLLTVKLIFNYGDQHTIGRLRISGTEAAGPVRVGALPDEVVKTLGTDARTDEQKKILAAYYRSIAPALEPARTKLAELKKARADLDAGMATTIVSRTGPARMVRILPRGNWLDETGALVTPSAPGFLTRSSAEVKDRAPTRLDLARWVASRENPLTARVFVNRIWKLAFGQGIVSTADDFGSQGTLPTHPELLDWLAIRFMESGWDVKALVRLIVTSGAYRQSSQASADLREKDPFNLWLARQGRFRVDAEVVRDNALAVSGLLVDQVGGAPARPYQPAGYWSHLNFPTREYEPDHGAGLYRRGIYTYWCRTFLHPSLLAFDAPTREECTVQRTRSNTPLQALVLLNDPIYVEAARALAERVMREEGDGARRVRWLYRDVLSRNPRAEEEKLVGGLFEKHLAEYRGDRASALELLKNGERAVPGDLDGAELAAWTSVARVILNLHETITRN